MTENIEEIISKISTTVLKLKLLDNKEIETASEILSMLFSKGILNINDEEKITDIFLHIINLLYNCKTFPKFESQEVMKILEDKTERKILQ